MPKFKLDCRACSKAQKRERGCTKNSVIPNAWELDGWKFSRCPRRIVKQQSFRYIQAYNFYKDGGGWPNPGKWPRQPMKLIEVIELIGQELNKEGKKI